MRKTHLLLFLALGIVLALALGLALQSFARSTVVMPMLYAAWLLQLVFDSVPGWLWWGWFLIIAFVLAMRSLKGRTTLPPGPTRERPPTHGPVRVWAGALRTAANGGSYFRWHLAHDLAELALQFTAYRDHRGVDRSDRAEHLAGLDTPPDILAYLRAGLDPPPWQPVRAVDRIARLWHKDVELTPLDLDPQRAIAFLEGKLERENDD